MVAGRKLPPCPSATVTHQQPPILSTLLTSHGSKGGICDAVLGTRWC